MRGCQRHQRCSVVRCPRRLKRTPHQRKRAGERGNFRRREERETMHCISSSAGRTQFPLLERHGRHGHRLSSRQGCNLLFANRALRAAAGAGKEAHTASAKHVLNVERVSARAFGGNTHLMMVHLSAPLQRIGTLYSPRPNRVIFIHKDGGAAQAFVRSVALLVRQTERRGVVE